MDAAMIKKTQDTLGKVIKKPPLTEKLLNKPPFRFLHDIITEVIKNTGFFKGLSGADELNSSKVTDKDAKISFLQKAIDCTGFATGDVLGARPSKIVAGHEPEKTNEFLQTIGRACLKKIDSQEAVKKVLAGEKPGKSSSAKKERTRSSSKERIKENDKGKDSEKKDREEKERRDRDDRKKSSSSAKDREKDKERDRDRRKKDSENDKEREKTKDRDKDKENDREQDKDKEKERERERRKEREREREREREKEKEREAAKEAERRKEKENVEKDEVEHAGEGHPDQEEVDDSAETRNIQRPSSAKGQRRRPSSHDSTDKDKENEKPLENRKEEEDPIQSQEDLAVRQQSAVRRPARPSSARPAPPKIKKQEEPEDPASRLGSGKQVASVIVDNGKDQDDDEDDTFVIQDTAPPEDPYDTAPVDSNTEVNDEEHGSLVRKMLESKREAETVQQKGPQRDKERPVIIDATRKKEKELAQKEIEKLRNSIQTLCRSAHPLGKIMDYLQEDIDSMQKELEVWRKENQKHKMALKAEQSITENEIEPLLAQLGELELEITDMLDKISGVKSNIIRNDEKIHELVLGVSR